MTYSWPKRKPRGLTWLFCVPVILVVTLAIAGNQASALKSSEQYPFYFDRALERFRSANTMVDSQQHVDLMTISLRRMERKGIEGQKVLDYAEVVDRQLNAISVDPDRWSKELISKVNAQNAFSDELINELASAQGPEQANEAALAMLYELPGRIEESPSNSRDASTYLEHSLNYLQGLRPEVRIRLLDAYVVSSVLKSDSGSSPEFIDALREARSTLAARFADVPIDRQADRLIETIDQLLSSPAERDLVIGNLERDPLFLGAIARASIMGDWATAGSHLATLAGDAGAAFDWYRRNARVLGHVVTAIFLDRHERGAVIDRQWLEGLDLSLRLDGSVDEVSRLVQSLVDFEVYGSSISDDQKDRKLQILEVMDGNPASDSALMIRIIRGSKEKLTRNDTASITEALEVAELLNAKILPLLVRQAFWELRTSPDDQPHITCAAVREWVENAEPRNLARSVDASLEGYAGYAYFLSATAALEDDALADAIRLIALAKKFDGPEDSINLLESRIADLSASDQSRP